MEDSSFNPGAWAGHSFKDAKAAYADKAGRSYTTAKSTGTTASDLVPANITTTSRAPLVIMVDVTGSMGKWPTVIFSKLPYLDVEGKTYLGPDMEISFAAVGDIYYDKYPVQVRPFGKDLQLKTELEKLVVEGGGGGGHHESYEMGALFYANNCSMPNAVKPIFIFVADEAPYDKVTVAEAALHAKVTLGQDLTVKEIFRQLKAKYSVYLIHKLYTGTPTRPTWVDLIGEDHIVDLQDPDRVVDVIFGILAKEANMVDYFKKEITARQKPEQVKVVYTALKTVHYYPAVVPDAPVKSRVRTGGKSTMHVPSGGKGSDDLL